MKAIVAILILSTFCALTVNGFLWSSKFKNGCDPNPCKNKAPCKLDAKNQNISTCACPEGFHGKHCESKTGCSGNPCRKGVCANNKTDLSDFVCACPAGFVGKKCDNADACVKTPCKNNAVCSLDAKLKPVCDCKKGWGSKNCDKRNCTIIEFKSKAFTKKSQKVFVDKTLEKKMLDIEGLANLCKVHLEVQKSFILNPDSKAVFYDIKDKTNPNFYIGQALSVHIYDQTDKLLCNDVCLGKIPIPQQPAKCFIDGLHAINLKWSILDPTVIHTGYHVANINVYNGLREHHQVGCRDTKFKY